MVSSVLVSKNVLPLLRVGGSPDTLYPVVYIHIESPGVVVNVTQDHFTVRVEFDSVKLDINLID